MALFTLTLLFSATLLYPLLVPLLLFATLYRHDFLLLAASTVAVSSLLWATERAQRVTWVGDAVAESWRRYFRVRVFGEPAEAGSPESLLLTGFPHGLFPMALPTMLGISHCFLAHSANAPPRTAIASSMFYLPFLAPLLTWLGCVPAERAQMRQALRDEQSSNACVVFPDGIAGIYHSNSNSNSNSNIEHLYLQSRRGFVQLALDTRSALQPFYCFGHTRLFQLLWPTASSDGWVARLSRRLRFCLVLFSSPVPKRVALTIVIGKPVRFNGVSLDSAFQTYVGKVRELFERGKLLAGDDYARCELRIV